MRKDLFLCLLIVAYSAFAAPVDDIVDQGTCGPELVWTLSDNNLTISGNGDMYDYRLNGDAPWCVHSQSIFHAVIQDGVTSIGDYAFNSLDNLIDVAIASSVVDMGGNVFYECNGLQTVYYLGTTDTFPNVLESVGTLANVCVSPDYPSSQFCGASVTPDNQACKDLRSMYNECYEVTIENSSFVPRKTKKAIEWEKQTNDCVHYQCNNEKGNIGWSKCNSSFFMEAMCVNKHCMGGGNTPNDVVPHWNVDIYIRNMNVTDVDVSSLTASVSLVTGLGQNQFTVGVVTDGTGYVVRISLLVKDETTASIAAKGIEEMDKKNCPGGIVLCRMTSVRIHGTKVLSAGHRIIMNINILLLSLIVVTTMISV